MNTKRIELIGLEHAAAGAQWQMTLQYSTDPAARNTIAGLITPFGAAQAAIDWAWVQWHIKPEFPTISDELISIARRIAAKDALDVSESRHLLHYHEYFLLNCAVLSGDPETMRVAAGVTKGEDFKGARVGIYSCVAGILRARINGDRDQEQQQCDATAKALVDRVHPTPSLPLLRAFVKRDYKALDREVAKGAKRSGKTAFLAGRCLSKTSRTTW